MRRTKRRTRAERRARRGLGVMAPIDMESILHALFENPAADVDLKYANMGAMYCPPEPARKYVRNEAEPKVRRLLPGTENQHGAAQTRGPQTQEQ